MREALEAWGRRRYPPSLRMQTSLLASSKPWLGLARVWAGQGLAACAREQSNRHKRCCMQSVERSALRRSCFWRCSTSPAATPARPSKWCATGSKHGPVIAIVRSSHVQWHASSAMARCWPACSLHACLQRHHDCLIVVHCHCGRKSWQREIRRTSSPTRGFWAVCRFDR